MIALLGRIMGSSEADVNYSDYSISGCDLTIDINWWFNRELKFLCLHDYFPEFFVSLGNYEYNFNNPETFDNGLFQKKIEELLPLKFAVVPLVQLAGYKEVAIQNGDGFEGYLKTAVDMGLFKNTQFETYENQISDYQDSFSTQADIIVMIDNALNMQMYNESYNGYKHYRNYGLDAPVLKEATIELKVGEKPYFSWYGVENADYYTIWDWTRNRVYDNVRNTYIDDFAPYTEPGTYAIGIYARSDEKGKYPQGTPINFNVVVAPAEGSFSPTPQQEQIAASINGSNIDFDVPPQIINDRTMVPVRAIFEALGARVSWDENTQTVTAKSDRYWVSLKIGSNTMEHINYKETTQTSFYTLDSPAVIIDGRTLVPARAVAEAFGCSVEWDANTKTVVINGYVGGPDFE